MDSALATLPLETLRLQRTEALAALHALNTGQLDVQLSWLDRRIQSNPVDQRMLTDYINRLQSAIEAKEGTGLPSRAPLHIF